ncbi:MAG: hypothetical protein QFB87_01395 [Patescibacteria group bacterium]|nr:hypothetical protein [Patescibacteria group bacterium]
MNSKRVYFVMLGIVSLLVLAIVGGAYSSKNVLAAKSAELVDLKAKLQGYTMQQTSLVQAKKDIATYTPLYDIAKVVVPENKNQAETVRQIVKLATDNSIMLGSISFPSSTLGTSPAGAAGPTAAKPTLGGTPAKVNIGSADLSQLTPVAGSPGVYVLQINVASDSTQPVGYSQFINFLSTLENNRLTAEVTAVNIVPDTTVANRFSFTLSLNSYIKP